MPALAALPVPVTLFGSPLSSVSQTLSTMSASNAGGSIEIIPSTNSGKVWMVLFLKRRESEIITGNFAFLSL